jgi:hypothetical protein
VKLAYSLKRYFLTAGIAALLYGCGSPRDEYVLGTIEKIVRSDEWSQVSLRNHNQDQAQYGDTLEVWFYRGDFDLRELDELFIPQRMLLLRATSTNGEARKAYEWKAESIVD